MRAAGCLLIVVLEILFFYLIGEYMAHRNDVATNPMDSTYQTNNSSNIGVESTSSIGTYVGPYTDRNGRFHKGHVRKKHSTHKNAVLNRARSRYYNRTHARKRSH